MSRVSTAIVCAIGVLVCLVCTTPLAAQSIDIPGDVPGVRFTTQDVNSCDPLVQVLLDPRTAAFREFTQLLGQTDGLRTLFSRRAGTIILPTSKAFEDFLDETGFDDLSEMINRTGGQSTWVPIISSYFLANVSNPPKDIVLPSLTTTPFGQAAIAFGVYGPTPRYNLYVYVDIAQESVGQYQMVSGYLRFAAPNMTSAGAILRATPRVNISDFAIACDQYYVYFTDDLLVPSNNPAELRRFGAAIPSGRASLTDLATGLPATVPSMSSSSASNSTRGRRLVAGVDVAVEEWGDVWDEEEFV